MPEIKQRPHDGPVSLAATVERKDLNLPRYVEVPSARLKPWSLNGTTVVELELNGVTVPRRTIKRWDERRWFFSVTEVDCRKLAIATGDRVEARLRRADESECAELATLLRTSPQAAARWSRLTAAQQRGINEDVAAAKQPTTRDRRARKALGIELSRKEHR